MRVIGTRHLHFALMRMAQFTSAAAVVVLVSSVIVVSALASNPEPSTTIPVSPSNETSLEVDGYGTQAPATGGKTLQGAGSIEQSNSNSNTIQNSEANLDALQPSSGRTDF